MLIGRALRPPGPGPRIGEIRRAPWTRRSLAGLRRASRLGQELPGTYADPPGNGPRRYLPPVAARSRRPHRRHHRRHRRSGESRMSAPSACRRWGRRPSAARMPSTPSPIFRSRLASSAAARKPVSPVLGRAALRDAYRVLSRGLLSGSLPGRKVTYRAYLPRFQENPSPELAPGGRLEDRRRQRDSHYAPLQPSPGSWRRTGTSSPSSGHGRGRSSAPILDLLVELSRRTWSAPRRPSRHRRLPEADTMSARCRCWTANVERGSSRQVGRTPSSGILTLFKARSSTLTPPPFAISPTWVSENPLSPYPDPRSPNLTILSNVALKNALPWNRIKRTLNNLINATNKSRRLRRSGDDSPGRTAAEAAPAALGPVAGAAESRSSSFRSPAKPHALGPGVVSHRGNTGGFRLSPSHRNASVLQIVEAVETPVRLNLCLTTPHACERQDWCPAHGVWAEAQAAMSGVLQKPRLAPWLKRWRRLLRARFADPKWN